MADGLGASYSKAAYDQQGMLATWLPDRTLRVGNLVSRSSRTGALTVEADLSDLLDEDLGSVLTTTGPSSLTFQQGAAVDAAVQAGTPVADAEISFTKASSFIFVASQGTSTGYDRLRLLRRAILHLAITGRWQDDWQLVTAVRSFSSCLLLIARGAGAAARVSLDIGTGAPGLDAVDASLGASIIRGDAAKWELGNCTPLYEGLVFHRGPWAGSVVDDRYLDEPANMNQAVRRALPGSLDLA